MGAMWIQMATLAIALVGAVLGVINTYRAIQRDRPRVVIKAEFEDIEGRGKRLRVDLINTGFVAVTIDKVGMLSSNKQHPHPAILSEGPAVPPHKLEPGARLTIRSRPEPTAFDAPFMRKVYGVVAIAVDGRRYKRKIAALRRHALQLQAAAAAAEKAGK